MTTSESPPQSNKEQLVILHFLERAFKAEKDCVGLIRDFCVTLKESNNENSDDDVCSSLIEKSRCWSMFFGNESLVIFLYSYAVRMKFRDQESSSLEFQALHFSRQQ